MMNSEEIKRHWRSHTASHTCYVFSRRPTRSALPISYLLVEHCPPRPKGAQDGLEQGNRRLLGYIGKKGCHLFTIYLHGLNISRSFKNLSQNLILELLDLEQKFVNDVYHVAGDL